MYVARIEIVSNIYVDYFYSCYVDTNIDYLECVINCVGMNKINYYLLLFK